MSVLTRPMTVRALFAIAAFAGSVRADGPAPAYLVEPGEQPPNSVPMGDTGEPSAAPAEVPPEEAVPDEGTYDATYDVAPPPEAAESPGPGVADNDPRALSEFSPRLDPYGSWTTDASYGKVWVPDSSVVGEGFSPYLTDGHWAVDGSGSQAWVSDYPFGDVVFHHGRWVWITAGWAWVPGYRYAPAWVAWRLPTDSLGYYGWAPLPPSFVWMNQTPVGLPWRGSYYWVFCPGAFVHNPSPASYVVRSPAEAQGIAQHTRAYVPASPQRSAPTSSVANAPRQDWAPGYRPLTRARTRVATAPSSTTSGAVSPHFTTTAARPRPTVARPPGATTMHAATPLRAPVVAPRFVNTSAPARAYSATFRGGGRR